MNKAALLQKPPQNVRPDETIGARDDGVLHESMSEHILHDVKRYRG
jgi:hypothetical protein